MGALCGKLLDPSLDFPFDPNLSLLSCLFCWCQTDPFVIWRSVWSQFFCDLKRSSSGWGSASSFFVFVNNFCYLLQALSRITRAEYDHYQDQHHNRDLTEKNLLSGSFHQPGTISHIACLCNWSLRFRFLKARTCALLQFDRVTHCGQPLAWWPGAKSTRSKPQAHFPTGRYSGHWFLAFLFSENGNHF